MKVEQILKEIGEKSEILYYANGGNAGDSLINMGFFHLAEKLNLKYRIINSSDISALKSSDIVVISGGGSLVPEWDSTPKVVRHIIEKEARLVILPHSIRGIDSLMEILPSDTVLFCREEFSYNYCINMRPDLQVYIDDDMAFKCDVNKILKAKADFKYLNSKNILRLAAFSYHTIKSKTTNEIKAFRCDKEANESVDVPRIRINDISSIARYGAGAYEPSLYSAKKMLEILDMYDVIYTDRLHVSVAGYLLGKEVHIYNNSYFKCLGVYKQSMSDSEKIKFYE